MWDLIVSVPDHCLSFYFGARDRKTYNMTCTPRGHISRHIRTVSAWPSNQGSKPSLWAAEADQTAWMCRLYRVFCGRTCHFVGIAVPRLLGTTPENMMGCL